MTSWVTEYLAALKHRDAREQAHAIVIEAYTKLAEQRSNTSATEQRAESLPSPSLAQQDERAIATTPKGRFNFSREKEIQQVEPEAIARLRADLSSTQRSRAELQKRVEDLSTQLDASKAKSESHSKRVEDLLREKNGLERRHNDLKEELRGKANLVQEVQDEMVSMTLQLNMAERKNESQAKELKELIDRWMAKMGEEADAMNKRSEWT